MEILIVHTSATQRRVFLNCLRKTGYAKAQAFDDQSQALEAINGSLVPITIIQKELLAGGHPPRQERQITRLLERSDNVLVASYQFTQHEVTQLRGTADNLLLMPFTPEKLAEKVQQLSR